MSATLAQQGAAADVLLLVCDGLALSKLRALVVAEPRCHAVVDRDFRN
nr:hypothetical protein [uncultured Undibacterium sp.]